MQIEAARLVETVERLRRRIAERIPETGLLEIAAELHRITVRSAQRAQEIRRANPLLRFVSFTLALGMVGQLSLPFAGGAPRRLEDLWELLQTDEPHGSVAETEPLQAVRAATP